ncbi:MAG: universal stress protein, partial [Candidatus Binataceae bacterium]
MAFPYKTILCPIDFDENSLSALDRAIEIARALGSSIR